MCRLAGALVVLWLAVQHPSRPAPAQDDTAPFDGVWQGEIVTDIGWCPYRRELSAEIRDGQIRGEAGGGTHRLTVKSEVSPDGTVNGVFGFNGRTVVKALSGGFSGDAARINWLGHQEFQIFFGRRRFPYEREECYGTIVLERVAR
ncbi:MAG: hypothetical protein QNJ92_01625 [Alphaproteobacteria bacterium]|nr:hypothetical protein [Alphaproteobacteria bacterium]